MAHCSSGPIYTNINHITLILFGDNKMNTLWQLLEKYFRDSKLYKMEHMSEFEVLDTQFQGYKSKITSKQNISLLTSKKRKVLVGSSKIHGRLSSLRLLRLLMAIIGHYSKDFFSYGLTRTCKV